ncbi:MAG: ABC transporter permease [Anaerolineae bacterium]|nr:ABC transporter permease [Anaerolineae bacterium]
MYYHLRHNLRLAAGLVMFILLFLFILVGPLLVDVKKSQPLSTMPSQAPSATNPLGSDDQGRDLLAVAIVGIPMTLRVGLIAGTVGVGVGTLLGFISGYIGGAIDTVIRGTVDTLLTVPGLVVLISIASIIREALSVEIMALVVASLAWMWPTRTIRSQVLTMREQSYVQMAKLNGVGTMEIIWRELLPNLLPYLAVSFVGSVSAAILASIGLEAIGLGPQNEPTVGMTIYWSIQFNSLLRGMWWWWGFPIFFIVFLFVSLFLISAGLDQVANPRLRRVA